MDTNGLSYNNYAAELFQAVVQGPWAGNMNLNSCLPVGRAFRILRRNGKIC